MDINLHLAFFSNGMMDPVVWLRLVRILFFFVAGLLMLTEPRLCGGKNKLLHRMLSVQFFVAAWYSWGVAQARMIIITTDPASLAPTSVLAEEIVYTIITILLTCKLGYDFYKYLGYVSVKRQIECEECPKVFEP